MRKLPFKWAIFRRVGPFFGSYLKNNRSVRVWVCGIETRIKLRAFEDRNGSYITHTEQAVTMHIYYVTIKFPIFVNGAQSWDFMMESWKLFHIYSFERSIEWWSQNFYSLFHWNGMKDSRWGFLLKNACFGPISGQSAKYGSKKNMDSYTTQRALQN